MSEIIATTERLVLRTEAEGDFEDWLIHLNTPEVMARLGGPQSEERVGETFTKIRAAHAEGRPGFWLVALKEGGTLIGTCGIGRIETTEAPSLLQGALQIGWRFRSDYWGKGYAAEAARAALALAFERYEAPEIFAQTSDLNLASQRLMLKLGMTRRAELDYDDSDYPAEDNPTIVYRLAREEWQQ